MISKPFLIPAATLFAAVNLQAQDACRNPGFALGVTAYQCASCTIKQDARGSTWSFGAEPVITEVTEWSVLKPGDVIQAVNDRLITTDEGSREFSIPPLRVQTEASTTGRVRVRQITTQPMGAEVQVRVRRNGASVVVAAPVRCDEQVRWNVRPGSDSAVGAGVGGRGVGEGGARGGRARGGGTASGPLELTPILLDSMRAAVRRGRGGGLAPAGGDSTRAAELALAARMIEQLEELRRSLERTGRFGIALSCTPTCARLRVDGFDYWKYDAPPSIAEVRRQSPAERAGLMLGDLLLAVDGYPITSDEGSQRFVRSATDSTSLRLTVRRNGEELSFQLNASPARGGGGRGARGRGVPPTQ